MKKYYGYTKFSFPQHWTLPPITLVRIFDFQWFPVKLELTDFQWFPVICIFEYLSRLLILVDQELTNAKFPLCYHAQKIVEKFNSINHHYNMWSLLKLHYYDNSLYESYHISQWLKIHNCRHVAWAVSNIVEGLYTMVLIIGKVFKSSYFSADCHSKFSVI